MFVATVQPHRGVDEKITWLASHGFASFRVNFSRGRLKENLELIDACIDAVQSRGQACRVFVDLPGPKTRVGLFSGGAETLLSGQDYSLDLDSTDPGTDRRAYLEDQSIWDDARAGDTLLLPGGLSLEVLAKTESVLHCRVINGGKIYNRCGITIQGRYSEYRVLTDRDVAILQALPHSVSFVCISFADNAGLIEGARQTSVVRRKWIAKIESPCGLSNMSDIAGAADGLMLGRGDLQTHHSLHEINSFGVQMKAIAAAKEKLFILATDYFRQMASTGERDANEEKDLYEAMQLKPDFIILNETSASDYWQSIALIAQEHKSSGYR